MYHKPLCLHLLKHRQQPTDKRLCIVIIIDFCTGEPMTQLSHLTFDLIAVLYRHWTTLREGEAVGVTAELVCINYIFVGKILYALCIQLNIFNECVHNLSAYCLDIQK